MKASLNPADMLPKAARLPDAAVLQTARSQLEKTYEFESINRDLSHSDWMMRAGNQWDPRVLAERRRQGRPALTINRLPTIIRQVIAAQRRANFVAQYSAVDAETARLVKNLDGSSDYSLAQVYSAVARSVERNSSAEDAQDWAFSCALTGGFGYWRIGTEIAPFTPDHLDITVHKILNPFGVFLDPLALSRGPHEGAYGFVSEFYDRDQVREMYPKATSFDLNTRTSPGHRHWIDGKQIRLADYYVKRREQRTVVGLTDGRIMYAEAYIAFQEQLNDEGVFLVDDDPVVQNVPVVYWYRLSGNEVLEGPMEFPSQYIPIVPVWGDVVLNDNFVSTEGIVRHAHDAQRAINAFETAITEKVGLSPLAERILTPEQVEGYESMWARSNRVPYPYLLYNHKDGVPPPGRQNQITVEPGLAERASTAHMLFDRTTGVTSEARGETSNAMSGDAISARQSGSDAATDIFLDNYRRAVRYHGRVLADMIPRVYDGTRVMRLTFADDSEDYVRLNQPYFEFVGGRIKQRVANDLGRSRFDVQVEAAPGAKSERKAASEFLVDMMRVVATAAPQMVPIVLPAILRNQDFDGARELSRQIDALIPPEIKAAMEERDEQSQDDRLSREQVEAIVKQAVAQALQQAGVQATQMTAQAGLIDAQASMQKAKNERDNLVIDAAEAEAKRIAANADLLAAKADLAEVGEDFNIRKLLIQ